MIHRHLIPDQGYSKLQGERKLLTFSNETAAEVLARWRRQAEERLRRLKEVNRHGQRYDPVTDTWY